MIKKRITQLLLIIIFSFVLLSCDKKENASLIVSGDYKTDYYLNEEFSTEGLVVTYKVGKK